MEWTNFKNLQKGEKYRIIIESYEFELIFCYYLVVNMVIVKIVMQYLQITKIVIHQMIHIKKRIQIKGKRQIQ
jgi:hypothetical protein